MRWVAANGKIAVFHLKASWRLTPGVSIIRRNREWIDDARFNRGANGA